MKQYLATAVWLFPATVTIAAILTRGMIALAQSCNWVAKPRADRWSKTPTALFGGVAIVAAFALSLAIALRFTDAAVGAEVAGLLIGAAALFVLGVADDARPLNPLAKLVGQVGAIMPLLVGAGLHRPDTAFIVSLPIVLFWVLSLTNAFNLLDNMDGLSAGAATIAGLALAACAYGQGQERYAILALLTAGSSGGFLLFNFRPQGPARIFMGDCGSLVLGYMLAGVAFLIFRPAIAAPSSLLTGRCLLPLFIMALPLFDTTLVTVIRKREGRAISQGGKDHSSHRLVYTGLSDKQAVLTLYSVAGAGGLLALTLEWIDRAPITLGALLVCVGLLTWFGSYLSQYKMPLSAANRPHSPGTENGVRPLSDRQASRQSRESNPPA